MSLATNITNLATRIATENKALRTLINGNAAGLTALTTTNKTNLVASINELAASIGGAGATINDTTASGTSVYSSTKTDGQISASVAAAKAELLGGAGAAYDTLAELKGLLDASDSADDSAIAAINTALSNRVRFDAVQTLTSPEQIQARANIGAGTSSLVIGTASGTAADAAVQTAAFALKAPLASPTFTGTVGGVTAAMVGLGNVTNTSDTAKPVSTAQQTALDLKANITDVGDTATNFVTTFEAGLV